MVDLPSLGTLEVTTKLERPSMSRNWRFVRMVRNDSARGLSGSACTMSGRSFAFGSKAMAPIRGVSVTSSTSRGVRMRVSTTERSTATPTPMARPTSAPSARFSGTLGLEGLSGGMASSTRVRRTGLVSAPVVFSIDSTADDRLAPSALAMFAA